MRPIPMEARKGRAARAALFGNSMPGDAGGSVANAVDRPVEIVGHQQRAILEDLHVGRPSDVIVVLDEAREERLDQLHGPVLVELRHDDVAADLLAPVPGAVARDEDRVAIFGREHVAGIEPHAERGCMRAQQCDRLGELVARVAPPEFLIGNVALVTVQGDKGTVFVGSRLLDKVYAIVDKGGKREVKTLYSGLYRPNGLAFKSGTLYIAELSKISKVEKVEDNLDNPPNSKILLQLARERSQVPKCSGDPRA